MKTNTSLAHGLLLTSFGVLITWFATQAYAQPARPATEREGDGQFISVADKYQERLRALVAERHKLKAGRSALFIVHRIARELRDMELQMSITPTQRVAALARYSALISEFEEEAVTALDRVMIGKWQEDSVAALLSARRDLK